MLSNNYPQTIKQQVFGCCCPWWGIFQPFTGSTLENLRTVDTYIFSQLLQSFHMLSSTMCQYAVHCYISDHRNKGLKAEGKGLYL